MNDQAHRNYQNLPKIGPVYSTQDEKQRFIAEEIINYRIRPEMKIKINMNIPGLQKKKKISAINPETRRIFAKLSSKGKQGWVYIWLYSNVARFITPLMCVLFYYYCGHTLVFARFYEEDNNLEYESVYTKMQSVKPYYTDKFSLMA
jgi:hypothetical protein